MHLVFWIFTSYSISFWPLKTRDPSYKPIVWVFSLKYICENYDVNKRAFFLSMLSPHQKLFPIDNHQIKGFPSICWLLSSQALSHQKAFLRKVQSISKHQWPIHLISYLECLSNSLAIYNDLSRNV